MESKRTELEDLQEHLERYRQVTLQVLEVVDDAQLEWRPGPGHYSLGQQLVHIAQAEDLHTHGIFEDNWALERSQLPKVVRSRQEVGELFDRVRRYTVEHMAQLSDEDLGVVRQVPGYPLPWTVRSGLWFVLEHELHHKGQIWLYLRLMGITPPFYAMVLEPGSRPDIAAREALGGF